MPIRLRHTRRDNGSRLFPSIININKVMFMKNKIIPLILSLAVIIGLGFVSAGQAEAQTVSFPAGCSSGLGYSVTTGDPCNGEDTATSNPMPGCASAFGYSVTNGSPCSGTSTAIFSLGGCSSVYGYSVIEGRPCNGTNVATFAPVIPGLPMTGGGGNAFQNIMVLAVSGLMAVAGSVYLSRKPEIS